MKYNATVTAGRFRFHVRHAASLAAVHSRIEAWVRRRLEDEGQETPSMQVEITTGGDDE
jgi:hypothetical protein